MKIKHNNVLGYFIETTVAHAKKMLSPPLSETFIHRQTTANVVRFSTVRLAAMETKILNAGNLALDIEKRLYGLFTEVILGASATIGAAARALSDVDLAADYGQSNRDFFYVRDTKTLGSGNGRGPVRPGHADEFYATRLRKML